MSEYNLNELNYVMYAAKYYTNPGADTEEFREDLQRIRVIKKSFSKYKDSGEINIRLVLNHIIIFYNVFEATAGTRILFLKLKDHLSQLLPFLDLLGYLPEFVENVGTPNRTINTENVPKDEKIYCELKKII